MFVLVCLIGEILALRTQDYLFIHNSCADQVVALSFAEGSVHFEQTGRTKDLSCLFAAFGEGCTLLI